MRDVAGREWIDFFAGAGALNYGHNHPEMKAQVIAYLEDNGIMHSLDLDTEARAAFLAALQRSVLTPRRLPYRVQFTGPTGTDAYDATLTDRLPFTTGSSLMLNPVIVSADSNVTPSINAGKFALSGNNSTGYTLTTNGVMQLPLNASRRVTVVVAGVLPVVVVPSALFTNTAVLNYTSLDGFAQPITRSGYNISSTERVYTATGPVPFRVLPLLATKEFITTSEGFTSVGLDGNPRAAIGEVVAYRLWIQLAESTSPSLTVDFVDNLPAGLEFITGTTRMAFVANGGGITSTLVTTTTPGCAGLNVSGRSVVGVAPTQVTCPMPANAISVDANGRPKFAFGGVSNFDTDSDGEFIVVQFNAVVKNVVGNQSGMNITNTFNVLINGVQADDSPPITTTVAEPAIALSKFANAVMPTDAGDLITYTLVFTNASGPNASTAFDVVLTDTLDANLELLSASLNAPTNPISYTSATNTVITTSAALTVSVAQVNPGAGVTVTAIARVRDATSNGARLPNTASLSYSSLPTTTGTISNPTGTATPGASGTITGERTSYVAQSNLVTTTLEAPTIAKLLPVPITYTIGELITYTILITVPEGVAQSVSVLDDLPSGLVLVSSQIISSGFNGVVPSIVPDLANGDVLYAFGNVTATADNQSNNNAFVVQVVAQMADVPANANGTVLLNTARLTYTNPISGVTGLSSAQAYVWPSRACRQARAWLRRATQWVQAMG
ncbi:MAG: isopeptide-forming domain-containing fimbrial protein [Anaerolineae bacterium]|nr:isopeptide-forming domain-containing fimbrial protein [Anaerolineae bacterium]